VTYNINMLFPVYAGYVPDNTTVFTRKGDVLALGELSLPADAGLSVKQSQVGHVVFRMSQGVDQHEGYAYRASPKPSKS
jgi:hypothetical protein